MPGISERAEWILSHNIENNSELNEAAATKGNLSRWAEEVMLALCLQKQKKIMKYKKKQVPSSSSSIAGSLTKQKCGF